MQKIISREEIEIKQKRNKKAFGIFFIVLLLLSTAGFALSSVYSNNAGADIQENEAQYNGKYWVYNLEGQNYYFSNKLEDVNFDNVLVNKKINSYYNNNLYIDAENTDVLEILGSNLARFSSRLQEACYEECERDIPEKDCSENLIVWRSSAKNKVYEEQNCVFIDGDLKTVDAFLYRLFGLN